VPAGHYDTFVTALIPGAHSRARRTAFGVVIDVSLSASSARLIVATPTADARAKS
jgi:hypothetical protein